MNFEHFRQSVIKEFYPESRGIFCIFDTHEYTPKQVNDLCEEALKHVTHGFLFQTSGTTANKKFVLHDFDAVKASCENINLWTQIDSEDHFLAPISIHHMGGFSVLARSVFAKAKKPLVLKNWNLSSFIEIILSQGVTVTSLVPSLIYEIVQAKVKCPPNLKTLFVGGSSLDHSLYLEAKKLKWPLFKTFGSSEACSQIFTQKRDLHIHAPDVKENEAALFPLPHWQVKVDTDQRLRIKGPSLYKGYLSLKEGSVKFAETPRDDGGYFATEDLVLMKDHRFEAFLGRMNDYVKINSTLVHLEALRKSFYDYCINKKINPEKVVITTKEDIKNGLHLVAYTELSSDQRLAENLLDWNSRPEAAHRIRGVYFIDKIPKTDSGKIKYKELT